MHMSAREDHHMQPAPFTDEGLVINTRLLAIEREQREEKVEQHKYNENQLRFNKWLTVFTGLLFATSIIADCLMIVQLRVAKVSADAAYSAVQEGKRSADAAESSLVLNGEAINENKKALEQTMNQNREALKSTIAQGQKALDTNIALSWIDQRPWVSIGRFQLSAEVEEGKDIQIKLWYENSGKTPALNLTSQSVVLLWEGEPPFTDFQPPTNVKSTLTLLPGSKYDFFSPGPWIPPAVSVVGYKAKKQALYIHALLRYTDMLRQSHTTRVCAYHMLDRPLGEFTYCAAGNSSE